MTAAAAEYSHYTNYTCPLQFCTYIVCSIGNSDLIGRYRAREVGRFSEGPLREVLLYIRIREEQDPWQSGLRGVGEAKLGPGTKSST